jgi:chromate transporter
LWPIPSKVWPAAIYNPRAHSGERKIDTPASYAPPRTRRELFLGFLSIGARAFGGVLPWAHRALVEERRWLTAGEFAEVLALCQILPGPNIANVSVVLGRRWFGLSGAIAAFLGLFALPFVWVLGLAMLYADFATHSLVRAAVSGIGIAGGGLFVGMAFKLARPLAKKPFALAIAGISFLAICLVKISVLIVLPAALAIALFAARRRLV